MFSIISINLTALKLGPSVTGVAYTGPSAAAGAKPEPSELTIPWQDVVENPSEFALLSWHTKVSEFAGRDREMEELKKWANNDCAVSVKFVSGEGGVGKSRMAAEFAEELQKQDWSAGFVGLQKSSSFPLKKNGTLLIVDYPEEHQDGVVELLRDLATLGDKEKVRLLFLSRRKIADWQDAIHLSKAQTLVDMKEVHIGSLEEISGYKLFCTAQKKASEIKKTTPLPLPEEAFTGWLSIAPENKRALFIIAMAVYSAIHPKDEVVTYKGKEIIQALVDRELERLKGIAEDRGVKDLYFFARLLAMAAIADNIPVSQVKELCKEESLNLEFPNNLDVQSELQNAGLLQERMILAPKPDIVAALFVVTVLAQKPEIAPEFLWHGLRNDVNGGLERLARLSYDAEVVLGHLEHRLSEWLEESLQGKPERCKLLDSFFSKKIQPISLAKAGVAVYKTLLPLTENEERKAHILSNLSIYSGSLGDRQEALNATFKAVELYERLAESNLETFEPNLATGLNNLGNRYFDMGDRQKALDATIRAVEIRERLAESNPEGFDPYLANYLSNLGNRYSNMGNRQKALDAAIRAVELYERLAESNPEAFEVYLSGSLNNVGNRYSAVGDLQKALEASIRAVEIKERLAASNPEAFEPDLATNLGALGNIYIKQGQFNNAQDSFKRAVKTLKILFLKHPQAHAKLMSALISNYEEACEKVQTSPDMKLLEPIEKELEKVKG